MKRILTPLLALCGIFTASSAFAQSTWIGAGSNANWDTAANWNTAPANGDDVTFLTGNGTGNTIFLNGNRTSGNVTYNNTFSANGTNITIDGGGSSVWTIVTSIQKTFGNSTFTLSNSTIQLSSNSTNVNLNHNSANGTFVINSSIVGASNQTITINNFATGTNRAVTLGGDNSGFAGQWIIRRGGLQVNANANTALGGSASNTITFNGLSGEGGNTLTLNTGTNVTWANNFVNNNASASSAEGASILFAGGTNQNATLTLSGNFSSGVSQHASNRLYLGAVTSTGSTLSEGRIILTGDWSGYNTGGATNGITLLNPGSIIIQNASALANSAVGYNISSTSAATVGANATGAGLQMSSKLILGGAFTMNNQVLFSGTGGNINSFGARHGSGTATLAGQLTNNDADGANVFSQNAGAVLSLTGQVSSNSTSNALHINRSYTFNNGSGAATANPVGIVEFARAGGISYNGTVTVHAGTLLVNNTSGSGTGTGALTVNTGATLGGNGIITAATTINGNLAPGNNSPGVLTLNGATTLAGTVTMELNGTNRGTQYDGINTGSGLLTYGGTMNLVFGSQFISGNTTFDLFQFGSGGQTGTFSSISSSSFYNFTLNSGNSYSSADQLGNIWSFNHSTGDLNVVFIPEPTTWALLAVGLTALVILRRRHRSSRPC
jgi:hypothetical protein